MKKIGDKGSLRRASEGVISIFLCLLMTPILTLTSVLIEYVRYQSEAEQLQEIIECSSLSALAQYDEYLQERFGLMAMSQWAEYSESFYEAYEENTKLMGDGFVTNRTDSSVIGTTSLTSDGYEVLLQQLLDYSENTAAVKFMYEEAGIEELLKSLEGLSGLNDMQEKMKKIENIATKLDAVVGELETLKSNINKIRATLSTYSDKVISMKESISSLFTYISEQTKEIDLSNEETVSVIIKLAQSEELSDKIEAVKTSIEALKLSGLKSKLDMIETSVSTTIPEKIEELQKSIDEFHKIENKTPAEEGKEKRESEVSVFEDLAGKISELAKETADSIEESIRDSIEEELNTMKEEVIESLGLEKILEFDFHNLEQFITSLDTEEEVELNEVNKNVINELLSIFITKVTNKDVDVPTLINTEFGSLDGILTKIKEMLGNLSGDIGERISKAVNAMGSSIKDSIFKEIKNFLASVTGLFELNIDIYSKDGLDTVVPTKLLISQLSGDVNNAQKLVDAIGSVSNAFAEFETAQLLDKIIALVNLVKAIGKLLVATVKYIGTMVNNIGTLVGEIATADTSSLYERFLLSSYALENFTYRTIASVDEDGKVTFPDKRGVTGFPFDKIPHMINSTNYGFSGANVEYICKGTNNEKSNQELVFWDIFIVRLLFDIAVVLTDADISGLASAAGVFSVLVYILAILGEAYMDTILIVNGNDVSLVKSDAFISPTGFPTFIKKLPDSVLKEEIEKNMENPMTEKEKPKDKDGILQLDYKKHLFLILLLNESSENAKRIGDLVQIEAASYYKKAENDGYNFDLSKAYTAVDVKLNVTYDSFFGLFDGTSLYDAKIHTTRGY